jgi:hypothetical protein
MSDASCMTCKFWREMPMKPNQTHLQGRCLRYPPAVIFAPTAPGNGDIHYHFPETLAHAVCGEWRINLKDAN